MAEEALFTWILVSSILFIKYRKVAATHDGMLSNLTVGLAIYVCVSMAGPITGGGLNPTFGLVLITTDLISQTVNPNIQGISKPYFLFSYIIGPFIGGILAALLLLGTQKITPDDINPDEDYLQAKRNSSMNEKEEPFTI